MFTVKMPALVAVPALVVTVTTPVVAPTGTVAVSWVAERTEKFAATPANCTSLAPVKFAPLMATTVPGAPEAGTKLLIVGAAVFRIQLRFSVPAWPS